MSERQIGDSGFKNPDGSQMRRADFLKLDQVTKMNHDEVLADLKATDWSEVAILKREIERLKEAYLQEHIRRKALTTEHNQLKSDVYDRTELGYLRSRVAAQRKELKALHRVIKFQEYWWRKEFYRLQEGE